MLMNSFAFVSDETSRACIYIIIDLALNWVAP